jgi:hypothetical protein
MPATDHSCYSPLEDWIDYEKEEPDRNGQRDYLQFEEGDGSAEADRIGAKG